MQSVPSDCETVLMDYYFVLSIYTTRFLELQFVPTINTTRSPRLQFVPSINTMESRERADCLFVHSYGDVTITVERLLILT